MGIEHFEYLQKYISSKENGNEYLNNWFLPIEGNEIREAEERLGYKFPSQLRNFYKKVGYGSLMVPFRRPPAYEFHSDNYINPPSVIADIMLLGHGSGYISQDVLDFMEPGDMPFFHVRDSCSFLVMRPQSPTPNAIWNDTGVFIEAEFNRFIWRLYYESPCYFDKIIEDHYAVLE